MREFPKTLTIPACCLTDRLRELLLAAMYECWPAPWTERDMLEFESRLGICLAHAAEWHLREARRQRERDEAEAKARQMAKDQRIASEHVNRFVIAALTHEEQKVEAMERR